jgi:hypothetical protein
MATTYRTDYSTDDGHIWVVHHGCNLTNARAYVRSASRKHGSAYIIRSVDGTDNAQIAYYDGQADSRQWQTA